MAARTVHYAGGRLVSGQVRCGSPGVAARRWMGRIVFGLGCWGALLAGGAKSQQGEPSGAAASAALEESLVAAIARCETSVVAIARVDAPEGAAEGPDRTPRGAAERAFPLARQKSADPHDPDFVPDFFGTGVIVDAKGLVVTNYHVVGARSQHWVTTADRKVYAAKIKAADPRSDLAVLELQDAGGSAFAPMPLGDASKLRKGQFVASLGNPYAIARDGQASASWGIISNLSRKLAPAQPDGGGNGKDQLHHYGTLIQTDAKLNLGTSGGALINLKGEMIGLTTAVAASAGYEQAAGFAVPVDETFKSILEALKQGKEFEYGFLGLRLENLRPEEARGAGGVRVVGVLAGAPAEGSGVAANDIITHVDGEPIADAGQLILRVGRLKVETVVRLTVERGARRREIQAELTKFPVGGRKIVTTSPPSWRGLQVDYATAADPRLLERGRHDRLLREGCVLISHVERDSPAWQANLREGMFIAVVEADGPRKVRKPEEFRQSVIGLSGPVRLQVFGGSEPPDQLQGRLVAPNSG